jgi:hypothetical protein
MYLKFSVIYQDGVGCRARQPSWAQCAGVITLILILAFVENVERGDGAKAVLIPFLSFQSFQHVVLVAIQRLHPIQPWDLWGGIHPLPQHPHSRALLPHLQHLGEYLAVAWEEPSRKPQGVDRSSRLDNFLVQDESN